MTPLTRASIATLLAMAAFVLTLAVPDHVAACLCGGADRGDVVFTGTVVESPNRAVILRAMFEGRPGVYTFAVESVERGAAADGRVYTGEGFTGCGRVFQLGATYRVHADWADPDAPHLRRHPGVRLETSSCMEGEQLAGPNPIVAMRALAFTPHGIGLAVAAILGVVLVGVVAGLRARSRNANP